MIDVKELRLGNKFLSCFGNIETVKSIIDNEPECGFAHDNERQAYSHLILCHENNNQYKPIEISPVILSESLLIDSGFWHIEFRDKWQLDGFGFQLEDPERTDKSDGYGLLYGIVGHEFQRIKYLHQLQNLYFALTGKELSIKK